MNQVHAKIYKCTSVSGAVEYSQQKCVNGFRKEKNRWVNLKKERIEAIQEKAQKAKLEEERKQEEKRRLEREEENRKQLEIKAKKDKIIAENLRLRHLKELKGTPRVYTRKEINNLVSSEKYPKQGSVKTITKNSSFSDCKVAIINVTEQFQGLYPEKILMNTNIVYTAKVWTNDAALTVSCLKVNRKMVITQAKYIY